MVQRSLVFGILILPVALFATWGGTSENPVEMNSAYRVLTINSSATADGRTVQSIRGTEALSISYINAFISLSTQDFSLPTRGLSSIPGLSRCFYHGVDDAGDGYPWYYSIFGSTNKPLPQFIPAGYWKFNVPFVRVIFNKQVSYEYADFFVYLEGGGCGVFRLSQVCDDWPNYLRPGPQTDAYIKAIEGFLYIERESLGPYYAYPICSNSKLFLIRRDGTTFEFQQFKVNDVGDLSIRDFKLNAVYGNTYEPDSTNKITYHYDQNTRLDSIETSTGRMIRFHYHSTWGVVDTIFLPDSTYYVYEYSNVNNNLSITKVTDPVGRSTEYNYSTTTNAYFYLDSIEHHTGLTTIVNYEDKSNEMYVDNVIRIDRQFTPYISDTYAFAIDTSGSGSVIIATETINDTIENKYKIYNYNQLFDDRLTWNLVRYINTHDDSIKYYHPSEKAPWGDDRVLDSVRVFGADTSYSKVFKYPTDSPFASTDLYKRISPFEDTSTTFFSYQFDDFGYWGYTPGGYFLDTVPNVGTIPRYFSVRKRAIYPNENGWRFCYNDTSYSDTTVGHGFLVKKIFMKGSSSFTLADSFDYDCFGNRTKHFDPWGNLTSFDWTDNTGYKSYFHTYPSKITDAEGNTMYFDYDTLMGRLTKSKDANGNITEYKYDNIGRITKIIKPGDSSTNPTIKYIYDDSNNKVSVIFKRGNNDTTLIKYSFDGFGNIRKRELNGTTIETCYYDDLLRLTKKVNAVGDSTWYDYDLLGRITKIILPDSTPGNKTNNPKITYFYRRGKKVKLPLQSNAEIYQNLKLVTDPMGYKRQYFTDALGQLREMREYFAAGDSSDSIGNYEHVLCDYDSMGNLIKNRDQRTNDIDQTYDERNRLKTSDDFDRGKVKNFYSALNQLRFSQTSKDTSDNRFKYFLYDSLGRLVENGTITNADTTKVDDRSYPNHSQAEKRYVEIKYDAKLSNHLCAPPSSFYGSTPNLKGKLSAAIYYNGGDSSNVAAECYEYDSRGRVIHKGVRLMVDNDSIPKWYEVKYEYDSADNPTAMIYPDNSKVAYEYNSKNQLTKITDGCNIMYCTFYYDNAGRDTLERYGNDVEGSFSHDARGFIDLVSYKLQEMSPFFKRSYEYDKGGNVTYEKKNTTTYASYEYDSLHRLDKEQYPQHGSWQMTYHYDDAWNRDSTGSNPDSIDSNSNRLLKHSTKYFYFDENGNMDSMQVGANKTTLYYDYTDRLTQVNEPGGDTTKYYYDGYGLRTQKWYKKNLFGMGGEGFLIGTDSDSGFMAEGFGGTPSYTITDNYYVHSGMGMVLLKDDNTPNWMTNASFEDSLTGWSIYVPGGYGDNFQVDTADVYAGSYSLKAGAYDLSSYESCYQKFWLEDINLKTPFILSAYIKTTGRVSGGAELLVQYEDSTTTLKSYASSRITDTEGTWMKVDLVIDSMPPDTAYRVCLTLRRYNGVGTIRFDAVRFENGGTRTPEVKYIYAGGKMIAMEQDGGIYYFHNDRLASTRAITDENGAVKKKYAFKAFGASLQDSGSLSNDYKYTSQALDENDLYYMHARYYDNSIGRFLNPDPAKSGHSYNYTACNPVNQIDPSGFMAAPVIFTRSEINVEWHRDWVESGMYKYDYRDNGGFVDASGQEENWYYTDLYMQLTREGIREDLIQLFAMIVNLLHNPIFDVMGINLGSAIEQMGVAFDFMRMFVKKDEGIFPVDGMVTEADPTVININSDLMGGWAIGERGLVHSLTASDMFGSVMANIAHEAAHMALFKSGHSRVSFQEGAAGYVEENVYSIYGGSSEIRSQMRENYTHAAKLLGEKLPPGKLFFP